MKQRTYQNALALLLCGLLLLSLLSGCAQTDQAQPRTDMSTPEAAQPMDPSAPSAPAGEKDETVYVKAAADGSVREMTSEVLLKATGTAALVRDASTLCDIRNTEGDEEYLLLEDGTLLWENHGADIHYKGTAAGELPVSVKITYWLDGQEIAPAQLAGRSGKVRIRFDYENHTRQTVSTKDGEVTVCTPFAALTTVLLPEEHFSNIEVENGRMMELDGENAVIGLALPGLSESLSLADFEPTEKLELPEYVELTADATDFALDFTATVVTPGLLEDVKSADLDKLDELRDDMKELQDATDELTDGVGELADGAGEFGGYLREYTGGVDQISDGAAALAQGLKTMDDQVSSLQGQLDELNQSLERLSGSDLEKLLEQLGQKVTLPDGSTLDLSAVREAAAALTRDEAQLQERLKTLETAMDRWEDYAAAAQQYASQVYSAYQAIPDDLTAQANERAREQVRSALSETGLTEDEISSVTSSIDLSQLTDPVDHAHKALEALTAPVMPDDLPDEEALGELTRDIQENMTVLQGAAKALQQQAGDLSDLNDLASALNRLTGGAVEDWNPKDGAKALSDGVSQLYSGAKALSEGAKALKTAGSGLNQGYGKLLDGMDALKEGMEQYSEEGISQLTDLTGESYQTLLRQIWGLKETDGSYHSFSGLGQAEKGSVRFIIETDKIG